MGVIAFFPYIPRLERVRQAIGFDNDNQRLSGVDFI